MNAYAAAKLPRLDWSMFVPRTRCGGVRRASSIGSAISPLAPVMEPNQPAASPVEKRIGHSHGPGRRRGFVGSIKRTQAAVSPITFA